MTDNLPGVLTWFRYVRHRHIPAYEAAGWQFVRDLGPTHGRWSVLMQWMGDGMPQSPDIEEAA